MEALIVAVFALIVIVVLEAGYGIVLALLRWAPMLAGGAVVGAIAHYLGVDLLEALGIGALTSLVLRFVLRTGSNERAHNSEHR